MDKKDKIDFIESMKILKCEPGDIVVLKIDMALTEDVYSRLKKHIKGIVKTEVLILQQGMDIGILRKNEGL